MQYITKTRVYDYEAASRDVESLTERYPFLERSVIGSTVLGRPIPALRWGEGACRVLLCGAHHGKEWITALLMTRFAEILCAEYVREQEGGVGRISDLYRNASYHIVPMLNPDGVELCIHGLRGSIPDGVRTALIRANGGSDDFVGNWQANANGVDLNHNYDAAFERGQAFAQRLGINGPGPTRYSGERPESEPESAALARLTRELMPDVCAAYHSQGEIIYANFDGKATGRALRIAAEMSRLSGYELDETEGMASCSGYKDWVINEFYLPAFTIEVGRGENPLPLSQFDEILQKNREMLIFLGQCREL